MKNDYWNSFYLKIASGMMVCWSAMMCFYIPFFFTIKDVRNYGFARGAKMYGVDSVINKIRFFENSTENFDCRANFPEKTLVFPAGPNKKKEKIGTIFCPKGGLAVDCYQLFTELSRLHKYIVIFDIEPYQIKENIVVNLIIFALLCLIVSFLADSVIKKILR
jgi:hypothetical protein